MKKEVVEFVCDNCGEEALPEKGTVFKSALPKNWVTVQMTWNYGAQEPVDLCDLCRVAFADALLKRRTISDNGEK